MGAGDHLVAVSNYDSDPATAALPRVGDYESIDWEKLSQLRPDVIVTYYGIGQTPAGFTERAAQLNMRQVNLTPARLSDVFGAVATLGRACGEQAAAEAEERTIRKGMESVRTRVAGEPRVRAVIVTDPSGLGLAGRETFLDDLLTDAGGENAVVDKGYVTVDREALASMNPDVVLQLLPSADAATQARAARWWTDFPRLRAVKEHRVYAFTEGYAMLPGSHVADLAAKFALALHPQKETKSNSPTTHQVQ